jgi:hypothetical protein
MRPLERFAFFSRGRLRRYPKLNSTAQLFEIRRGLCGAAAGPLNQGFWAILVFFDFVPRIFPSKRSQRNGAARLISHKNLFAELSLDTVGPR